MKAYLIGVAKEWVSDLRDWSLTSPITGRRLYLILGQGIKYLPTCNRRRKMKAAPSYTKVLTIGSSMTENALVGDVIIQEKVDGSLFCFGWNEDGELTVRSKGKVMDVDGPEKMFQKAVDYIVKGLWKNLPAFLHVKEQFSDCFFYCEYLEKPKHNVLPYSNPPKNNLVLFDALIKGKWANRNELETYAHIFDIDVIPELFNGEANVEKIQELLTAQSYLGGQIVEGVVIKNYHQTLLLGGQVFPLFTKFVREEFKEKHATEWKYKGPSKGMGVVAYIDGFKAEGRWQKSIIHAKELGTLTNSPKDIGPLMKLIEEDVLTEETENIKEFLFKTYKEDVVRAAVRGFPQWYKEKLLENLNGS